MAHMHWPDQDPIGRRITFGTVRPRRCLDRPWFAIVGVVSDVRYGNPEAGNRSQIYLPVSARGRGLQPAGPHQPATRWPSPLAPARRSSASIPTSPCTTLARWLGSAGRHDGREPGIAPACSLLRRLALLLPPPGFNGATAGRVAQRRRELALRMHRRHARGWSGWFCGGRSAYCGRERGGGVRVAAGVRGGLASRRESDLSRIGGVSVAVVAVLVIGAIAAVVAGTARGPRSTRSRSAERICRPTWPSRPRRSPP